jgi:methylmalonyl-CoA mutase cobalamin-binding subunit
VGWIFALDEIHDHACIGSMYYGDTLSFTENFDVNRGVIAEYLLWDIIAQLRCPTGHAVHPLPVTEAVRVPSAEEIAEAQVLGHRMEEAARRMLPHIDFSAAYQFSDRIVSAGKRVFHNALEGLKEAGVDIRDPIRILYVLKKIGPATFEELFGDGRPDEGYARQRIPIVPTDVFERSKGCEDKLHLYFRQPEARGLLSGHRVLIVSTDVHEHALFVMHRILSEASMEVVNLGPEKGPDEIVSSACMHNVDAILVSTHNGMALEYAKNLKEEIHKRNLPIPVVMGGILNQKSEDSSMPMDVSSAIKELGFQTCRSLEELVTCARLMWPRHNNPCQ